MSERLVEANGVEIYTQTFGSPFDPPVLLIMGACASMVWWPDDFCRQLSHNGRFVIRFDNRDTGKSVTYAPGVPPYTLDDMAADALGVLDAYGIKRAHVFGASLGGMIGQMLALSAPERVITLTLIMSSQVGRTIPGLPPIEKKVLDYHASAAGLDWSNRAAVVAYMAGGWRLTAGGGRLFDGPSIRAMADQEFGRAKNLASMFNHSRLTGGESYSGRLGNIKAPTLVIHGTDDPVLPYAHGVALAKAIPNAELLTLEGAGHEIHRADWSTIVRQVFAHTNVPANGS